jgi:hypothetical protein
MFRVRYYQNVISFLSTYETAIPLLKDTTIEVFSTAYQNLSERSLSSMFALSWDRFLQQTSQSTQSKPELNARDLFIAAIKAITEVHGIVTDYAINKDVLIFIFQFNVANVSKRIS